ncbi:MAG: hypothetical protein HGB06_05330 [Chlorobaculum sp.]|jgi:hypothetical protein|nr:hypothetical protein [Chlorobaculum sp.]
MERYYFVEYFENLQDDEHKAATNFALNKSKELNARLVICVNKKKDCGIVLEKFLPNEALVKKLKYGQEINIQGVTVTIESQITLRKQFIIAQKVYVALYPSKDMMMVLEKPNTNAAAIIVFSEPQYTEHLFEWINTHNPNRLECQAIG